MNKIIADSDALARALAPFATPVEAAKELGISRTRVQHLMTAGALRYTTTPYGRMVHKLALEHYKAERELKRRQACPVCGQYCKEVATCAS